MCVTFSTLPADDLNNAEDEGDLTRNGHKHTKEAPATAVAVHRDWALLSTVNLPAIVSVSVLTASVAGLEVHQ